MGWRDAAPLAPGNDWRKAQPVVAAVRRDQSQPQRPPLNDDEDTSESAPTSLQSAASGVVQGASLGFGDEISAALDLVPEATHRTAQAIGLAEKAPASIEGHVDQESANDAATASRGTLADYYRQMRDRYRAENKEADAAHPVLYGGGKIAGSLVVPIPGGTAKTLGGKMALGAAKGLGFGTTMGVGESDAQDLGGIAKDAAKTGALGAAGGAAGGLVESGASALAARFGSAAEGVRTAAAADALEKAMAAAKGALGHSVQDSNRALINMKEALKDPNVEDFVKRDIEAFLGSQKGKDLVNQVAQNTLDSAPEKLGNMANKKADLANAPLEAAAKFAANDAKSSLANDVLPRLWHYARPALAAGIGGVVGGPIGAAAGGLLGAAAGKPGRAIANLARNPRFQSHALDALETAARPIGELGEKSSIVGGSELEQYFSGLSDEEKARLLKKR